MRYTSDLTDAEWQLIDYCFPKPSKTGRPREHPFRELLNAIFYLVKTGCQWRNVPKTLPRGARSITTSDSGSATVCGSRFTPICGNTCAWWRGETASPARRSSTARASRAPRCSDERGYDAGKKVNGRKRHILVDTIGLLLLVMVLPANIQDRDGAKQLLAAFFGQTTRRRVKHIWADGGYAGALLAVARKFWRCTVEIVKRTELHTFKVLPRRWVVERTFGWLGRYRRLNRDYERQATPAKSWSIWP